MQIDITHYAQARNDGGTCSDAIQALRQGGTVIAVLCDGAGTGRPAHEAAHRAVAMLAENYSAHPRAWSPEKTLREFVSQLNRSFYQESMALEGRVEMITTIAAAVIEGDQLYAVNAGDSRIYLRQAGSLRQLSVDHADPVQTNMLTKALGLSPEIEPSLYSCQLADGDAVLLCSDGVWNNSPDPALADALQSGLSARRIVLDARQNATAETLDDTSAIVLQVRHTGKPRPMTERELTIPTAPQKGDIVDGWQLIRSFLSTDRVWVAEKDGLRKVLKFAPVEALDSPQHLDAFIRETWNATRVKSDHFVQANEPAGQTSRYYVMEFIDAPSLQSVLRERRLSVDSAVSLGKFLASAAQALLRVDLAHGDIKPENILCVGDYAALSFKCVDLGSAAALFSVSSRAGTASYLAPERFRQAPLSERTEIFAIGVTLYQSLTEKLPYGEIERFQTPVFAAPQRPSKHNPNIPPWLDAVILRAIARKPEQRYSHYSELLHDLNHPERVQPCYEEDTPLLQRNPLAFYRAGFFVLLALVVWLALKMHVRS
jgi:serine/threonine protein phosphatase PrpC